MPGKASGRGTTKEAPKRSAKVAPTSAATWIEVTAGKRAFSQVQDLRCATVALHFDIVGRLPGAGWLVAGHLSDPNRRLAEARIEGVPPTALGGLRVSPPRPRPARAAEDDPAGFDFFGLAPGGTHDNGVKVSASARDGEEFICWAPENGDPETLSEVARVWELESLLTAFARVGRDYAQTAGPGAPLPGPMLALMEGLHRRLCAESEAAVGDRLPVRAFIDAAERIADEGFVFRGWLVHSPSDRVESFTLVSLLGQRKTVAYPFPKVRREDVRDNLAAMSPYAAADCGFVAYAAIAALPLSDPFWRAEIAMQSGTVYRAPFRLPPPVSPRHSIETVAAWAGENFLDLSDAFDKALSPPLVAVWRALLDEPTAPVEVRFGEPPRSVDISVVVPLYGRIDFLRHQIANFSNDLDFSADEGNVELIYVLDDPRATKELQQLARAVFATYGAPFRVIDLGGNFGYSRANNVGAAAAIGKRLILLNSDVIPKQTGWTGRLSQLFDAAADCGVLGCRLLHEDGSLQHAGIEPRASSIMAGTWETIHTAKGLPVAFDPHAKTEPAWAVTGACLMVERQTFLHLGGLNEGYVLADFEDSDLCLRMRAAGRRTYYTPEVELFHLERQSMRADAAEEPRWRRHITLLNMWLFARRWRRELAPPDLRSHQG